MTETELEDQLSQPTPLVIDAMRVLKGDILILGAGGKMGPSLARLAVRASREAGRARRVIAVARFSEPGLVTSLSRDGVETIPCDLFDAAQVARLPDVPNIIYMVGQKFGTTGEADRTWAVNAYLPGVAATRFPDARIVAFSTGNVYPLWPTESDGPTESDPTGPIGEYAQSALARERVLEHFSRRNGTPISVLRLNYAVEPRYGVVRDIADRVRSRTPVDLAMAKVNLIWQRDANAIALASLSQAAHPPMVLNLTGPAVPVRWIAEECGRRLNVMPVFSAAESGTALLSNPAQCVRRFGRPPVDAGEMIARVVAWVAEGGRSLNKPTHFETRDGAF
jgi:nucleoside-diphosphate-sugar epimerase